MLGIPLLGKKRRNIKDIIILILAEEFPLKTKRLYNILRKRYAITITYQGVHKAVTQLAEDNVLVRLPEGYTLNENWMKQLEFFARLCKAHREKEESSIQQIKSLKRDGDISIITANSVFEVLQIQRHIRGIFRDKFEEIPLNKRPIRITHLYHIFTFVLHILDAHEGYLKDKYRFHHYYIIEGNTAIDQESVGLVYSYPQLKGLERFSLNTKLPKGHPLAVYDDIVLEVYYPKDLKKLIDKFFNGASSISSFDSVGFFKDVIVKSAKIKVIVYKDRQLADSLIRETVEYFKNDEQNFQK